MTDRTAGPAMTLTRSRPGVGDRSRRDLSAPWRHVDPVLLVCALAIAVLGVLMVLQRHPRSARPLGRRTTTRS